MPGDSWPAKQRKSGRIPRPGNVNITTVSIPRLSFAFLGTTTKKGAVSGGSEFFLFTRPPRQRTRRGVPTCVAFEGGATGPGRSTASSNRGPGLVGVAVAKVVLSSHAFIGTAESADLPVVFAAPQ
jgi:hypothetical protein